MIASLLDGWMDGWMDGVRSVLASVACLLPLEKGRRIVGCILFGLFWL